MDWNTEKNRRITLAINKIDGAYYLYARSLGVNENKLALLYALDDGRAHSQKQISQEWLIPKTTVNTIVRELVMDGYVILQQEGKGREKRICLTESGIAYTRELLKGIYQAERLALQKTVERFSPDFIRALEYLADQVCEEYERLEPDKTEGGFLQADFRKASANRKGRKEE